MTFRGGIHPEYQKRTADLACETFPLQERYVVPVSQHLGAPGELIVEKKETVMRGQPLTRAQGFVSAPVHAPTSGTVKAIKDLPHPSGGNLPAVEIMADGDDTPFEEAGLLDSWRDQDAATLKDRIAAAGLVGMGGAAFPTHVKLSPPPEKKIDTFILNGAECEPYLTSDHRVMVEEAEAVIEGVEIFMRILGVERGIIGIESNKPDAIEALRRACPEGLPVDFVSLAVKYPQGSEKHLISALTRREVPAGGLPMDAGCLVQNVATAAAATAAVRTGSPLIERVTTVTGNGISRPANLRLRVGTPLERVLEYCGGLSDDIGKVIFGGPMMGISQHNLEVPILKGTSGILCLPEGEVATYGSDPCLRCGACVDVCPMGLVPATMAILAERERFPDLENWRILDCIECGSCAWSCPSARPLVQLLKRGKAEWRAIQTARKEGAA